MSTHLTKTPQEKQAWKDTRGEAKDDPRAASMSKWRLRNFIYQRLKKKDKSPK